MKGADQSAGMNSSSVESAHGDVLECIAVLCPEDEGGFSIHCVNLPGVISQGDDESEAVENIKDAFRETVKYHRDAKKAVPWAHVEVDRCPGARELRIPVVI